MKHDSAYIMYKLDSENEGMHYDKSPFKFVIGQKVGGYFKCFDQALVQMRPGETATITCPPDLATENVEGNSANLYFDIEVISC